MRKVANELDLRLMQTILDETIQFGERNRLRQFAKAAAARTVRKRLERKNVDGRLFIGMSLAELSNGAVQLAGRADDFDADFVDLLESARLTDHRVGIVGAEERAGAAQVETAFAIVADHARSRIPDGLSDLVELPFGDKSDEL